MKREFIFKGMNKQHNIFKVKTVGGEKKQAVQKEGSFFYSDQAEALRDMHKTLCEVELTLYCSISLFRGEAATVNILLDNQQNKEV